MKTFALNLIVILLLLISNNLLSQENNNFGKTNGDEIIAYCYQPIDGSGPHQIYSIHVDGSENYKMIDAEIGLNHHDWSPDGNKMAAVGYVGSGNDTWSIHVFDAGGTNLTRLTFIENVWDNDPNWSPDGEQICFTRIYPDQNYFEELWIMDKDGSNQHWIEIEGASAKWSPDGTRLIYFSEKNGNYDLYSCNIDGTGEQQITNSPMGELTPEWSPDGSKIAYTRVDEDMRHDICIMDSNGQNIQCLTGNTEHGGGAPHWSPNGLAIAFHSGPFEGWEVFIINDDGTGLQQVTNSPTGKTAINPDFKPGVSSSIQENTRNIFNLSAYPNPFSQSTTIEYNLFNKTHVVVKITDAKGGVVSTLKNRLEQPGKRTLVWDGTDNTGSSVPTGIYYCLFWTGGNAQSLKLFWVK